MLHTELFCGLEKSNPGYAIRQSVFVNEQGFASDLEFDKKDRTAFHILVFSDSVPNQMQIYITFQCDRTC